MHEGDFRYAFVHEYLRYIQRHRGTLTGVFELGGHSIVWGAVAEYGPPPVGGLLLEMTSEMNRPGDTALFRFWIGRENRNGKVVKGRNIFFNELGHEHRAEN